MGFGKFVLVAVVASVGYGVWAKKPWLEGAEASGSAGMAMTVSTPEGRVALDKLDFSRARITMYSLTTCVYCKALRETFDANGVPYREYFVDEDPSRMDEMVAKLQAIGFQGGVGTPTLEVNGRMMPNNPPLEEIVREALGGRYPRRA